MPLSHRALAVLVSVLWGLNFLAIDVTVDILPPLFAVALRFALIAVPTVLLVPRPQVPLRFLIGYGLGFGVVQFVFLYTALALAMPPGLASLVLQSSAPFTLVLGALLLRERPTSRQWVGIAVAVSGLLLVATQRGTGPALLAFALVLAGGLGWALGNLSARQAAAERPLHLSLWMSVLVPVPMLLLSLLLEGPDRIAASLLLSATAAGAPAWWGMAYTVVLGSVVGSGLWSWLLSRHPAGVVAPFSMLVPVSGMVAAALWLGERRTVLELVGAVVVVAGVLLGSLPRRRRRVAAVTEAVAGG